ncbi:RNI-like protein [Mycena rebaudengoi]|nr:RNI-like protein [Mycena rebaudengoi]
MANNVRGPASALTEFLRSTGITATTIARRVATQTTTNGPAEAGPSTSRGRTRSNLPVDEGYASDDLDEPESPPKKKKLSKAAEAKLKAKAKKRHEEDEDYEEEDAYTAPSKSAPKPPVGSFANCATCEKQFTVTKYTMAANPGPGFLCHPCAKASGTDPFKKPAAPRKRKTPAEKRTVVHFEERSFPSLVSICIDVIARHIDDVEAFGDIGAINMEAISKALSKTRRLTSENAPLFYGAQNEKLALYDATNLLPAAFTTLGQLNPNLTTLRLDFCGPLNDAVMSSWTNSFPMLHSVQLLGPFLVREAAWIAFFQAHPNMQEFLITQSPRFSLACLTALLASSETTLRRLALREVGQLSDEFLPLLATLSELTYLDLAEPAASCTDEAVVGLLAAVGASLVHLDLSGHSLLTDEALTDGIAAYARSLSALVLADLPALTDAGVAAFFSALTENPPLLRVDLARNHELAGAALDALLAHSSKALQELSINGWKDVDEQALNGIERCWDLRRLDVGWCRCMDDFVVKRVLGGCQALVEVKVWGCGRVEGRWGETRRGVRVHGVESESVL